MSVYSTTWGEITTFTVTRSRRRIAVVQQIETLEYGHKVRRQRSCEVSLTRWCDTFFPLLGGFLHATAHHPADIAAARHVAANQLIARPYGPPVRMGDPPSFRSAVFTYTTLKRAMRQAKLAFAKGREQY